MDLITRNQGLQHISEEIFLNLDQPCLMYCQKVNQFWKKILNNPMFWLKKCVKMGLLKHYHLDWMKLIQSSKDPRIDKIIKSCLMNMHSESHADYSPIHATFIHELENPTELIRIAAPILDNPNSPFPTLALAKKVLSGLGGDGVLQSSFPNWTPIQLVAYSRNTSSVEIIGILAPLTEDPNAPDPDGWTPISWAACKGNTEMTKHNTKLSNEII